MRKILLIAFLLLAAFSQSNARIINSQNVSVDIPDNWTVLEAGEPMLVLAEAPKTGSVSTNMILTKTKVTEAGSAEKQKEMGMNNLQSIFSGIKLIESNGNFWVFEDSLNDEELPIMQIQYFYVKDNFVYTLTFSSAQNAFRLLRPVFEKIEGSLILR
ncbi:MAG: hypothetical protein LBV66_00120 [Elusimicrobiota bacterium]|jgi:hypothetical protein|nr:hypothetical protein [Elusimicrobiota bacterium]